MKNFTKIVATLALGAIALTGCSYEKSQYEERKDKQEQSSINGGEGLEVKNLKEKAERENDPNATRYVYLWVPGDSKPVGYYVLKGKVSSSGSQMGPEQELIRRCSGCDSHVMDSAKDDGSYGEGDPGIFFFLANGTMTDTNLIYLSTDAPLPLNVPLLGEIKK